MREGLRSGKKRGEKVDSGRDDGELGKIRIPDLNVKEESDVVSCEEGEETYFEVTRVDGKSNGSICEREAVSQDKVKGMDIDDEEEKCGLESVKCNPDVGSESKEVKGSVVGQVGNVDWKLQLCSKVSVDGENKTDDCSGILGQNADVGREVKESGVEGLSSAVDLGSQVVQLSSAALEGVHKDRFSEDDKEKMVYGDEKQEAKENSRESDTEIDKRGVSADSLRQVVVDSDKSGVLIESHEKMDGIEGSECKFDEDDQGACLKTETEQGSVQAVGKVLRSRIVPANGLGEDSGGGRKRKKATHDRGEGVVTTKGENDKSVVGTERTCRQGLKKSLDHTEGEIVQMNEVQVVPKVEYGEAYYKTVNSSMQKGKRGRPKKYVDCPEEDIVEMSKVQAVSEVEDVNNDSVRTSERKGKRGRPKKSIGRTEEEETQMNKVLVVSEVEDDNPNNEPVSCSNKKGRCGRPRKLSNCAEEEEVVCEVEEEAGDVSNKSNESSKLEEKIGRPKRSTDFLEEVVQTKKVPFCEIDDQVENLSNKSVRNKKQKGKRGRPKRQEGNGAVKMKFHDKGKMKDDRKRKVSLVTAPVRRSKRDIHPHRTPEVPSDEAGSIKGISSVEKNTSGGTEANIVDTSCKGEETPMPENNLSVKRKRVEAVGSTTAVKNSIRKQIVDMLLGAGWTVEYRPRQGRQYNDAVYVNPEGKTHWSVTKAYNTLKLEVEEGKVGGHGNSKFSFTPIPEEVLSKLFRVVSKTRSDKNKKKKHKKGTGDSSDEESDDEKLAARGKAGAKHRHSASKRKPSVRDGKRRCALLVRRSNQGIDSEGDEIIAPSGKHSVLAWMIDSGTISLDGKVHYMNRRKTKSMLDGSVTRDGIHCSCCKEVISVSEFESHAGSKLCAPYENVCLDGGKSLLQCLLDSWNKQEETGRTGFHNVPVDGDDPNDDSCGICGDGGDLVCCDSCPSTFHHDCLTIEEVPSGEWNCAYCSCKFCGRVGETALQREDCETTGSSLVTCSFCDEKHHQSCIDPVDAVCTRSRRTTFCGRNCEQIFERLQTLLGAKHGLEDGFSWTLLQRSDANADKITLQPQKTLSNSKLAVALSVMDECFLPILDPRSGINLIKHIVYNCGSNFNRLNFSNFFTVILERGDEVIAAASIRIHAKGLAEMPFIGTRNVYRRQGMCRRLLGAIELALGSLDVENLVIPAIPELMDTWTSVFGFKPLEDSVKEEMRSMSMLVFPHTGMLQKPLSKQLLVEKTIATIEEDVKGCESENEHLDNGAAKSEVNDGWINGTFDLNSVAPDIPESSLDERRLIHPASTAGNYEDEVQSEMALEGVIHKDKVDGQSTSKENDDDQSGACALGKYSSERTMRPDLNLIDENVSTDTVNPDIREDEKHHVNQRSATVNADEILKNTADLLDLTSVEGPSILENASEFKEVQSSKIALDRTRYGGLVSRIVEDRENVAHEMQGDENGAEVSNSCDLPRFQGCETAQSSSLMACQEAKVGCSIADMSDACETVALGVKSEDVSSAVKFVSKCESPEVKVEIACDRTVNSSNEDSPTLGAQLPTKSSESQEEYKNVTPIASETLCNMSSGTGDTCIPGIFHGNGVRKVGSSK